MTGRQRKNTVYICTSRDQGPQCGYASYNEVSELEPKGKAEFHRHSDADGRWVATVWGPESLCEWKPAASPDAAAEGAK